MSARIPPGYAEMWLRFDTPGCPDAMYASLGVELDAGTSPSLGSTNSLIDQFGTALRPIISSDYTVRPGHVIWGSDGGDIRIDSSTTPVAGQANASGVSNNTALLVQKITGLGGRRHRGRFFMPGLTEPDVSTAGAIGAAYLAAAQTAVDTLRANVINNAPASRLVLFHSSAPFAPTPVDDLNVSNYAATQRRRMCR